MIFAPFIITNAALRRTQEFVMADFLKEMIAEGTEAIFHDKFADEIRNAAASGESDDGIFRRVLKAIANPNGPFVTVVNKLPSFTLPVFGVAISHLLSKTNFIDRLLPDDVRPVVRQAKWLLKTAGPNIIVGVLSGVRDATQDINRINQHIDREVDKVRSGAHVPESERRGTLDRVAWTPLLPHRLFVVELDGVGDVRKDPAGNPVVNDPDLLAFQHLWAETHKNTTKEIFDGKDRPKKSVPVSGEPFRLDLLSLEDGVARTSGSPVISPADMASLMSGLKKPVEWWDEVGPGVRRFFLILGRSVCHGNFLQYDLWEDHIKDVIGKRGISFLQDLATFYNPKAADERFSMDVLEDIIATFDTALGSELNWWNKCRRAAHRAWANRRGMPVLLLAWFIAPLVGIVLLNLAMVALFVSSFAAVALGALMPYEGPAEIPLVGLIQEPRWLAAGLMLTGAWVLLILLSTLRIWQRILSPIAEKIFKVPAEWLAEFGWRFTFLLVPIFVFVIGALLFQSSLFSRLVSFSLAGMGIGIIMGLKVAAQNAPGEWAKQKARIKAFDMMMVSARFGWLILFAILLVDFAYRHWDASTTGTATIVASGAWGFLTSKDWLAILVRFGIGFALAASIFWGIERFAGRVPFKWLIIFVCALIFGFSASLGMPKGKYVPFDDEPAVASPASSTPVAPETKALTSKPKRPSASAPDSGSGIDCDSLSYARRKALGCP